MIILFFGSFILGGFANRYGSDFIYNYCYPRSSNINNNTELCIKCDLFTDNVIPHCDNCGKCHHRHFYKICNNCKNCIFHSDYNSHTKKYCFM